VKPDSICVVGGCGQMGRLVSRLFRRGGYRVEVADTRNGPVRWEKVGMHDVVILAVPMRAMESVVRSLGPFSRADGAVIDLASLKEVPLNTMLAHCKGEVLGCHPLFGPAISSLCGQTVFLCPGRSGPWTLWFRKYMEEQGAVVKEMDPRLHDQLMGFVQVLRHLLLLCFGRTLQRLDFRADKEAEAWGPWFSDLMNMLRRQMNMTPELLVEIALGNPLTPQLVKGFGSSVTEIIQPYLEGDKESLISLFSEIRHWSLGEQEERHLPRH